MLKNIIHRPVLATVISIVLVLLGLISLSRLPVMQFPDIAPPTIYVAGLYPGGNSESVTRSVITPLEESINGVENMQYIKSTAGSDGSFSIQVIFNQGTNPDQAAVNVQNRVAQVNSQIPAEVIRAGITTTKQQNSNIMFFNLLSRDSSKFDELFLQNYAKINLVPALKRIKGIGNVQLFGSKDYAMRIWLNPQKLTVNNLVPQDIETAIANSSLEASPGKLGEESKAPLQYIVKYKGKLNQPEQFEQIILKAKPDGSLLRLRDVARIEFGSAFYDSDNYENGKPAVTLAIQQVSGSNANEIEIAVRKSLEESRKNFPKGVDYDIIQSVKERLDQSIDQVKSTLMEAFILVFIVVFLFLQDWRSTLIPAIAVPVAIVGTFFFLQIIGFSINVLTLFALVLAIGIVVDDAIVVVEAVHAKMENENMEPEEATVSAMQEITGAILSITLVMAAVFLPVGFMSGPAGVFYKQFAFTLASAILISAVNALTLSPALCALFLKNTHGEKPGQGFKQRFVTAFNTGFDNLTSKYVRSIRFLIHQKWIGIGALALVAGFAFFLMNRAPKDFVPNEDDRFVIYSLALAPGNNLKFTTNAIRRIDQALEKMPEVESVTSISGFNLLSNSAGPSYGVGFIRLKAIGDRGEINDMDEIIEAMTGRLASVKEGELSLFRSPPVEGFGSVNGSELVLQDKTGGSLESFNARAQQIIGALNQDPAIGMAFTTFRSDFPQFEVEVDEDKAFQLGTTPRDVLTTLQLFYGGAQSSDFVRFGKFYRVNVKAEGLYRMDEESLNQVFVKNANAEMIPIGTLVKLRKVYGPEVINRYNLFSSITVNIMAKDGYSNSQSMDATEKILSEKLPSGYGYEWSGLSREEKESSGQMVLIFGMCVVFTYFLLAAQYESYLLPLAVILSIPTGLLGVYLAIGMAGITNNIYVQIGLIMLIGLLAKNAILIVEFALKARQSGMEIVEAALEGAQQRFRPILMTSLAFVAGLVPLMFATGASAVGNRSISTSAAGGMITGVLLGLLIIPLLFVIFQSIQEKVSRKRRKPSYS
ncbi:hydrophobe/amphiphile efflux-1 family RND transporter [Siphonobacter sp. SORGH_AS_0500]|uniref:efflux RND transporter permease subunit n=1 Tax=Siphonobacter sp. SORGH_AS_0500 TaxID=1864824 RepID=UPI000CB18C7A|nr:efflux RND transporter permease subunit [Siphonobacter sp. SORGH_AS_0500]PKK35029.1 hydrophobe/amphiphile efflux-1 family RND transporter [Siphonobacter sp. SORGH_AS_0500]